MEPVSNSALSSKDKPSASRPYGLEALALAALSGGLNDNNNTNNSGSKGRINNNNGSKNTMNVNSDNISSHNDNSGSIPTESIPFSKSTAMLSSSLSTPKAASDHSSRMTPISASAPSPNQSSQIPQAILQQLLQEPSIQSLLSRLEQQQQPNTNGTPSGSLPHISSSSNSLFATAAVVPTSLSNGFTPELVMTRSGRPSRPPQSSLHIPHNLSHVDDQLAALHQAWAGLDTSFLDGIAGSLSTLNSLPSSGPAPASPSTDPFTSSSSLLETPTSNANVASMATAPSSNLDLNWWWPFQDEENEDEDPSYDPSMAYPDLTPPTLNITTPGPSTIDSLAGDLSQPAASTSGSMERLLNNAHRTLSKRKGKGKAISEEILETSITDTSTSLGVMKSNGLESVSIISYNDGESAAAPSAQEEEEEEEEEDDDDDDDDDDEGRSNTPSMPGGRLLRKRKVKEKNPPPPPKRVKLTAEESAARRKARNKELASNSRKRQREYVVGLEARIVELEVEVKKYKLQAQQAARDIKAGPGKNIYDVVSGGIKNPHPFASLPSIPTSISHKALPQNKKSTKKKHPEEETSIEVVWPENGEEEEDEEDEEWQSQGEGEKEKTVRDLNQGQHEGYSDNHLDEREGRSAEVSKTDTESFQEEIKETQAEEDRHEEVKGNEDGEEDEEEDDDDDDDSDSEDSALEDEDDEDLYQPIIDVPVPVELASRLPDASTETTLGGSPRPTDTLDMVPAGDKVGNEEIMDLLKKLLAKMGGA